MGQGMPLDPKGMAAAVEAVSQGDLFADAPLFAGGQVKRPGGRPPGAMNKTTKDWVSFMRAHYRSPLLFLADTMSANTFDLAEAIRRHDRAAGVKREVSVLDVLAVQRSAAENLAPYLHRKQPIAVDGGEDKPLPTILQVTLGAGLAGQSAVAEALIPLEVAAEKSHDADDDGDEASAP
jgi:hypothetical protein